MVAPTLNGSFTVDYRVAFATLAIGIFFVVVIAFLFGVSAEEVANAVGRIPWMAWIALPAAQAGLILMSACKWHLLLEHSPGGSAGLRLRHATSATTIGTLAGQVLPLQFVTPAVRAWTAKRRGVPVGRAVGTSIFEQVFEVIVLVSMAIAGLLVAVIGPAFGVVVGLGLVFVLLIAIRAALRVGALTMSILERKSAFPFLGRLKLAFEQAHQLPRKLLAKLIGLSILRYALMVWLNLQILAWLMPGIPLLPLAVAFPIVQAVTALPIVTGGLGLTEATWIGLLLTSGLEPSEAAATALALRVVSTIGFLLACPLLIAVGQSRGGDSA